MTDHPIIFSAPMVRALLDGRKTQTRRLAWRRVKDRKSVELRGPMGTEPPAELDPETTGTGKQWASSSWQKVAPGDRLWVRENLQPDSCGFEYAARGGPGIDLSDLNDEQVEFWNRTALKRDDPDDAPIVPCIHLPRWASRLTLVVTATKVEPLQAISEEDARAEGAMFHDGRGIGHSGWRHDFGDVFATAHGSFCRLWHSINGPESWAANPEVVAFTFRVIKANIDQTKE